MSHHLALPTRVTRSRSVAGQTERATFSALDSDRSRFDVTLQPLGAQRAVELQHGETVLGRDQATRHFGKVHVTSLGRKPADIDGDALPLGVSVEAFSGQHIQFVHNLGDQHTSFTLHIAPHAPPAAATPAARPTHTAISAVDQAAAPADEHESPSLLPPLPHAQRSPSPETRGMDTGDSLRPRAPSPTFAASPQRQRRTAPHGNGEGRPKRAKRTVLPVAAEEESPQLVADSPSSEPAVGEAAERVATDHVTPPVLDANRPIAGGGAPEAVRDTLASSQKLHVPHTSHRSPHSRARDQTPPPQPGDACDPVYDSVAPVRGERQPPPKQPKLGEAAQHATVSAMLAGTATDAHNQANRSAASATTQTANTASPANAFERLMEARQAARTGGDAAEAAVQPKGSHSRDGWSFALVDIARHPENYPNQVVEFDDEVVVVRDRYPKARHHYLIMPREDIPDIFSLRREHATLVRHLQERAYVINKRIVGSDPSVRFRTGFHAVPSMRQVHLHLISLDFDSVCLKTKRHWNTFTTEFFVRPKIIYEMLRESGSVTLDKVRYEALLDSPLRCHRCNEAPRNMPALKRHIQAHK